MEIIIGTTFRDRSAGRWTNPSGVAVTRCADGRYEVRTPTGRHAWSRSGRWSTTLHESLSDALGAAAARVPGALAVLEVAWRRAHLEERGRQSY